ncbi:glutamate receptor 2.7-like [Typha latifolia]|uniref:glutamate receptor 2.7-like n=1 Tax=Typha latifolia TaxID=4733 RepID=UPI003C2C7AF7
MRKPSHQFFCSRSLSSSSSSSSSSSFFFFFFFFFFLSFFASHQALVGLAQSTAAVPVRVGVILDFETTTGKRSRTSISMAIEDFYAAHPQYTTRVVLSFRDSHHDIIEAASAAVDLLGNAQVQAVIGPHTSPETEFVAHLCNQSQVPLVSFSATSPALSPAHTPFFVRATLNDSSQASPIAALVQSFGWRNVVPIYENSNYGAGIVPSLIDALQSIDSRVPYRAVIPTSASDSRIDKELNNLMTMQTRVFVVHMLPGLGSRLFRRAKAAGMMTEGYVWITTDSVTNAIELLNSRDIDAMQGVIGFRPYMANTSKTINFTARFKARLGLEYPRLEAEDPSAFQLWAYDAVWAVAMAVERAKLSNPSFRSPHKANSSSDLGRLGVSLTGPKLLDAILNTAFDGMAGQFRLLNGQLQLSGFEIVNIIGNGPRTIGFWTPTTGLSPLLSSTASNGKDRLKPIVWPGDPTVVPKGWQIPSNGMPLRIAVPVKRGFKKFVNVENEATTNKTKITGYCIDIFDAVMKKLPYPVPYEYVPFYDSSQSYDNLVYQVYLKKFDAVVGDTTILANRTNYVEFTLPYTESGVSMIVAVKKDNNNNAWIFLKPLTTDLWLMSLAFFFFTGFVVWLIEHRINPLFRGTPSQQFGTIFYFSFSTLVFSHKENLESNLSKFVVIIWVFVVLILTSSYTASLTSMLTVQQLQPTIADVSELLRRGDFVGYQDGTFIVELLKGMNFDEHKLKNYSTPEQYAEALSKGTANGGVTAIFDEIPYLRLFLSDYYADYTMVGPTYKTDGFGFVFPRGSPLVPDVSRAILNVTEGEEMAIIERTWFGNLTNIQAQSSSSGSASLAFWSFRGLFLITGLVSILMLIIYLIIFFCKEWDKLKAATSERTVWKKVVAVSKHYDRRESTAHTSKIYQDVVAGEREANQEQNPREAAVLHELNNPESPKRTSNYSESIFDYSPDGPPTTEPSSPYNLIYQNTSIERRTEIREGR